MLHHKNMNFNPEGCDGSLRGELERPGDGLVAGIWPVLLKMERGNCR